ncbi:MAG: ribosome silencing factor [Runella slithyformis]|nr:MAG: ribosome silencing factor [Runella slithyformis]TAE95765.1 MAG: ribosome silencing factor [Runella slithyformis]TAF22820.1 MAG: ribosome silencing factor [Runella slithyformis]TAF43203.1 MAG: ribosome silencing factor [Runella slithyformis]TAF83703.1 MAG: ribosome silencing factor [Runella slithyformis]
MKQRQSSSDLSSKDLAQLIVRGMQEKKAVDIIVMDLREIKNAVTDFFVICSGNSDVQIDAIADSVEEETIKTANTRPWQREGKTYKEWILLDYVDVVVHVFKKDRRAYYDLELLWGDAIVTQIEESLA